MGEEVDRGLRPTAERAGVTTVVVVGVVALALALWKLRLVVALLLLAFTIASAMRPGVEWLAARGFPRALGVMLHYAVALAFVVLSLSFVVPRLTNEVQTAIGNAQAHRQATRPRAGDTIKERILDAVDRRLGDLPKSGNLVHPAVSVGEEAFKVLVGILFTFAAAAYWIFERDAAVDLVAKLLPRPKRKTLRDTWTLIDQKLGAFVRGELLLIALVSAAVSAGLALIGVPYWLLIGILTGILEIIPVVGPLVALLVVIGAGLTVSWHTAVIAGAMLLGLRVLQDYLVTPRVLGGAVGVSPLIVLVSVFATGILLGGFYVLLAIPLASLIVTVVDVVVRGVDPAEEEVPTVLFPVGDAER